MIIGGTYTTRAYQDYGLSKPKFGKEFVLGDIAYKETSQIDKKYENKNETAFKSVGPNAPDEVKNAWMEAAEETGANGLGMLPNGMLSHISQFQVQRAVAWCNGKNDFSDVLGNSVESAIKAAEKALYDIDNPLEPITKRSVEVQQAIMKERSFYESFLDKLRTYIE
ncbi:hypothetical protein ACTGZ3_11315 [Clostridioides difficile]|uniref:hypothetical protein n=1 Tax=Clostridioides difficile TaxID=1496 RepID=UPI0021CA137C|nr:hypothetical protein [Clostridioides difficile]UUV09573.1 hypothetical protein NQ182_14770 [Clostridioides difficile]HCU2974952.1 hypothetical protein [Clostridioides difficile]HCU3024505.1 hypothetical protein [Clostridioides difficile]